MDGWMDAHPHARTQALFADMEQAAQFASSKSMPSHVEMLRGFGMDAGDKRVLRSVALKTEIQDLEEGESVSEWGCADSLV